MKSQGSGSLPFSFSSFPTSQLSLLPLFPGIYCKGCKMQEFSLHHWNQYELSSVAFMKIYVLPVMPA